MHTACVQSLARSNVEQSHISTDVCEVTARSSLWLRFACMRVKKLRNQQQFQRSLAWTSSRLWTQCTQTAGTENPRLSKICCRFAMWCLVAKHKGLTYKAIWEKKQTSHSWSCPDNPCFFPSKHFTSCTHRWFTSSLKLLSLLPSCFSCAHQWQSRTPTHVYDGDPLLGRCETRRP